MIRKGLKALALASLFFTSIAQATENDEQSAHISQCRIAVTAIAPISFAWDQCEQETGKHKCVDEIDQLFEVSITALEKCGPLAAKEICAQLGDIRGACTHDKQCERGAAVWMKHCS